MLNDEHTSRVEPVPSPWLDILLDALSHIQHTLLIVSPYIKEDAVTAMQQALPAGGQNRNIEIRILTRVNPDDLLSGASDIAALQQLLNWSTIIPGSSSEVRAISNLHAKVWICDRHLAIIGSGNATLPGLSRNLEYGLSVSDPQLVERILTDWQHWWDLAQRVEAPMLDDLTQKLRAIKESDAMRQVQAQTERIKQHVKSLPHVGQRVTFSSKRKRQAAPIIKETTEPLSTTVGPAKDATTTGQAIITTGFGKLKIFAEDISVHLLDFWQALRWVLPLDESEYSMISSRTAHDAYLKLAWRPTPHDHQTLQLLWADGKRYSQASLPAHNEVLTHPWAITCNMAQIHMFGELLQTLKKENLFTKHAQQQFHVRLLTSPTTLSISYLANLNNLYSATAMTIPCMPATLPGNFPTLRAPLSCITIAHEDLRNALSALKQEWEHTRTTPRALTIIELSFATSGPTSSLTLSSGQIEAPLARSIVGTNCTLAGSEVRLRIDSDALQQVLAGAPQIVHNWRLYVDKYADAIQFIPEPDIHAEPMLVWRHELRNL